MRLADCPALAAVAAAAVVGVTMEGTVVPVSSFVVDTITQVGAARNERLRRRSATCVFAARSSSRTSSSNSSSAGPAEWETRRPVGAGVLVEAGGTAAEQAGTTAPS